MFSTSNRHMVEMRNVRENYDPYCSLRRTAKGGHCARGLVKRPGVVLFCHIAHCLTAVSKRRIGIRPKESWLPAGSSAVLRHDGHPTMRTRAGCRATDVTMAEGKRTRDAPGRAIIVLRSHEMSQLMSERILWAGEIVYLNDCKRL